MRLPIPPPGHADNKVGYCAVLLMSPISVAETAGALCSISGRRSWAKGAARGVSPRNVALNYATICGLPKSRRIGEAVPLALRPTEQRFDHPWRIDGLRVTFSDSAEFPDPE